MDLSRQSNVSAFNMLSRLVITFLPRSKRLLISWLHQLFKNTKKDFSRDCFKNKWNWICVFFFFSVQIRLTDSLLCLIQVLFFLLLFFKGIYIYWLSCLDFHIYIVLLGGLDVLWILNHLKVTHFNGPKRSLNSMVLRQR